MLRSYISLPLTLLQPPHPSFTGTTSTSWHFALWGLSLHSHLQVQLAHFLLPRFYFDDMLAYGSQKWGGNPTLVESSLFGEQHETQLPTVLQSLTQKGPDVITIRVVVKHSFHDMFPTDMYSHHHQHHQVWQTIRLKTRFITENRCVHLLMCLRGLRWFLRWGWLFKFNTDFSFNLTSGASVETRFLPPLNRK